MKYAVCGLKTLYLLWRRTPRLVFVQNPSIVLAFLASLCRRLGLSRVVVDFHTPTIALSGWKAVVFEFLLRFINRSVDLVIVSNDGMKSRVEAGKGKAFVLPDKIPAIEGPQERTLKAKHNVLLISTFAEDEPIQEVVDAARCLSDVHVYITGDIRRAPQALVLDVPSNVEFTGHLPEDEYRSLLNSVDAVMDLTTKEDCLVCGAYEAVAVGRPLITSNTDALKRYFSSGAVYADNSSKSIVEAIRYAIRNAKALEEDIKHLGEVRSMEWRERWNELWREIGVD